MALFFAHRLGHKAREFESTDARLCATIDDSSMINEAMKLLLVPGISIISNSLALRQCRPSLWAKK